ncbi:hypothetical protein DNTS_000640, partial [Danionella cerebrum]
MEFYITPTSASSRRYHLEIIPTGLMSAQGDCEYLVKRARELVTQDPCAAKSWLITARTLYPSDFNIQYEMYSIERNAERTTSAGRLLYDISAGGVEGDFSHYRGFEERESGQTRTVPQRGKLAMMWVELHNKWGGAIQQGGATRTSALRLDTSSPGKTFLSLNSFFHLFLLSFLFTCGGVFEALPGPVQCKMLLKATEQCFNTLERAEMLLLLLKRFPESVIQHGVSTRSYGIDHPVVFSDVSLGESLLEAETVEDLETPVNCFRKLF